MLGFLKKIKPGLGPFLISPWCLFLFFSSAPKAEFNQFLIWQGKYQEVRESVVRFVNQNDINNSWANEYQKRDILSFVGRHAAIVGDAQLVDWIRDELLKVRLGLMDKEYVRADVKPAEEMRVTALYHLLALMDKRNNTEQKIALMERVFFKSELSRSFFDDEYISFCNARIDVYIQARDLHAAEQSGITCLAQISLNRSHDTTAVFTFMARLELVYLLLGNVSSWSMMDSAFSKLFDDRSLRIRSPEFLQAATIYAYSRFHKHDFASYDLVSKELRSYFSKDIMISKDVQTVLASMMMEDMALQGYEVNENILALPDDLELLLNTLSDAIADREIIISDVDKLEIFSEGTSIQKFYLNIIKLTQHFQKQVGISSIQNHLWKLSEFIEYQTLTNSTPLKFEHFGNYSERLLQNKLLVLLAKRFPENIPEELTEPLMRIFFSDKTKAQVMSQAMDSDELVGAFQKLLAQSYIQMAEDLTLTSLQLLDIVAEDSISYTDNYSVKERRDVTKEGSHAFKLLHINKSLSERYSNFENNNPGQFTKAKFGIKIGLNDIQDAISKEQAVVAYIQRQIGSQNFIFRCIIRKEASSCKADKIDFNFTEKKVALRSSVGDGPFTEFDRDAARKLYTALFGTESFQLTTEINIFPPSTDLDLPFNALMDDRNAFVGLTKNLVILGSLNVKPTRAAVEKPKVYLGIGDPLFNRFWDAPKNRTSVQLSQNLGFGTRAVQVKKELQNLQSLPETRDELEISSKAIAEEEKTLLLGETATELNFRTANAATYEVIHFATHGITSGSFDSIRQPSLALSPPLQTVGSYDDGLLTAREIAELNFDGARIILSACETAANYGNVKAPGLGGLASSFISANASEVIATQWKIESISAARLISNFALSGDLPTAMSNESLKNDHPFFWAPFIKFGFLEAPSQKRDYAVLESEQVEQNLDGPLPQSGLLSFNNEQYMIFGSKNLTSNKFEFKLHNLASGKSILFPKTFGNFHSISDNDRLLFVGTIAERNRINELAVFEFFKDDGALVKVASHKLPNAHLMSPVAATLGLQGPKVLLKNFVYSKSEISKVEYELWEFSQDLSLRSKTAITNFQNNDLDTSKFMFWGDELFRLSVDFNSDFAGEYYDSFFEVWCTNLQNALLQRFNRQTMKFEVIKVFDGNVASGFIEGVMGNNDISPGLFIQSGCYSNITDTVIYDIGSGISHDNVRIPQSRITRMQKFHINGLDYFIANSFFATSFSTETQQSDYANSINQNALISSDSKFLILLMAKSTTGEVKVLDGIINKNEAYANIGSISNNQIIFTANLDRDNTVIISFKAKDEE